MICHGDFGPWNVVWQGHQPVGIIDSSCADSAGARISYADWPHKAMSHRPPGPPRATWGSSTGDWPGARRTATCSSDHPCRCRPSSPPDLAGQARRGAGGPAAPRQPHLPGS
ncbi:hypothetical protein [Streptomyces sp. NPDC007369]|uniref:hypothetical protein n=1 Tax=Streptomyces sp. NPDC007369 TaxID=3154589 RepID=UPI0033C57F32